MRVFLSYHSPDGALAEALKHALEASHDGVEVFFAPQSLRVGNFFVPQLGTALDESDAFLLLLGERTGRWQLLEYYEAFDRHVTDDGFPLVPVITAEKAPRVPFLNMVHWIEAPEPGINPALAKIRAALTGDTRIEAEAKPWALINPYRGLEALGEADADYFFGRETETADIIDAFNSDPDKVIALVGNSGVGKSSLAQAGVIAALKRRDWPGDNKREWPARLKDSRGWLMLTMKPGDDPVRELVRAFVQQWYPNAEATDPKREQRTRDWAELLTEKPDPRGLIEATYEQFNGPDQAPPAGIFLYVDQGEELYARAPKARRDQFSQLLAAAAAREDMTVLTSLRSDYYGDLQNDKILFPQTRRIDVPPLGPEAFRAAIEKPAELLKVTFESSALIDQIVAASADQPGALPLIADLLTGLWDSMQARYEDGSGDGVLRWSDRPEVIQIGMPLAQKADDFLTAHPNDHDAIRRLLTLKLAHVPPEGDPVRRRLKRSECDSKREWQLIEALAHPNYRLVVTSSEDEEPTAEVAHEILLREWPTLKRWLEDEHDFLVWKGQIEQDLKQYQSAREDEKTEAFLMGLALTRAEDWFVRRGSDLNHSASAFIANSIAERNRRNREELDTAINRADAADKAKRWQTLLTRVLGVMTISVLGFALFAYSQMQEAKNQAEIAKDFSLRADIELKKAQINQSRFLMAEASEKLKRGEKVLALNIAVHAILDPVNQNLKPTITGAREFLRDTINRSPLRVLLEGHDGTIYSAQFSADGSRIVSAGADGTVRIWSSDGREDPVVLKGHEGDVKSAYFSTDDSRIVSTGYDGTVRVWEVNGIGEPLVLNGHEGIVYSARFSFDNARIVSAGSDGTVRVWTLDGSSDAMVLTGHQGSVRSAMFSTGGARIVSAGDDGTVRVWDFDDISEPVVLTGHESSVYSAQFSNDGSHIVSASNDGTVRVWASDGGGDQPVVLKGHENWVYSANFSIDGESVVSAGEDGTVRVWLSDGTGEPLVLSGHKDFVLSLGMSADGTRIVSAGDDGTVRVWEADGIGEPLVLNGHKGTIYSAEFNPEGTQIVSAGVDGIVHVWAVAGGHNPLIHKEHEGGVYSAIFSGDGTKVASASADGTVHIWNADGSDETRVLQGHKGEVKPLTFSGDGTRLASGGADGTVRLWTLDESEVPIVLEGHDGLIFSVQFDADSSRIVSAASDGTARVWTLDGGGDSIVLNGHDGSIYSAEFSTDGSRIVSAGADGTVRIWLSDGSGDHVLLKGHEGEVNSAHFSADDARIVSAGADGTVRIWSSDGRGDPVLLIGHEGEVNSAHFGTDDAQIVSAGADGTVRIWSSNGSEDPVVLKGHEGLVDSALFSNDGAWIVSADIDGTVRVWATDGSRETLILNGHEDWVRSAQFSPDGTRIVSAGDDGTVRVWRHRVEDLVELAIKNLPRCMTPEERAEFFLDPQDPVWCERFKR